MGVRMVDGKIVTDDDMPLGEAMSEVPDDTFTAPNVDASSTDSLCLVCDQPIPYGGRGPRPKYHPEHRPTAPKRNMAPSRSGTLRNEAALRAALLERYMQLGMLASLAHPAYGAGIKTKAEAAVDADIEYARVSPSFRRILESAVEKSALGVVIAVHASMLAPIVVGERAKAARKGAARQAATQAPTSSPIREAPRGQARPSQPTPAPTDAALYDLFPSQESDAAPESINAGAMPGMPG